jgi:hypothetical protein
MEAWRNSDGISAEAIQAGGENTTACYLQTN